MYCTAEAMSILRPVLGRAILEDMDMVPYARDNAHRKFNDEEATAQFFACVLAIHVPFAVQVERRGPV